MLKLLVFVLPLALDSFAVAIAIGAAQATTAWQRLRISLILMIFEGGMPLIGLGLGSVLAHRIGFAAGYLAAIIVGGIGGAGLYFGIEDVREYDKTVRKLKGED